MHIKLNRSSTSHPKQVPGCFVLCNITQQSEYSENGLNAQMSTILTQCL